MDLSTLVWIALLMALGAALDSTVGHGGAWLLQGLGLVLLIAAAELVFA